MRSRTLALLAAVALVACSKDQSSAGGPASGGTFVIAAVGEPIQLFPAYVQDATAKWVQDMVFDRLAEVSPDLNSVGDKGFAPRLAKSWTWAPDSLSIAFAIDPRAKWHDGKPVTASDIRYTFKVFTDPKAASPVGSLLTNVDSVSVRDSMTAVAWFKKRTPTEFYDLVYQLIPVPEHVYGSIPMDQLQNSEAIRTLVGSGQFKFVKWEPKVRVDLIADTANYRGRPKLDRIILSSVADPNAGMAQVLAGQADFMQAYPIDQIAVLDSNKFARSLVVPTTGYTWAAFNPNAQKSKAPHPVFADLRTRRALSMGLDRVAMLKNVFGTLGRLGHGPFANSVSYADTTVKLPPFDTTAAKALLDSAGWKAGADGMRAKNGAPLAFTILSPTSSLTRKQYATLMQEGFRKLGAKVEVEMVDAPTFNSRVHEGSFDLALQSFNQDPAVAGVLQAWGTVGISPTGFNIMKYSSKKVDAELDSASAAADPAKSREIAHRAFQQIADDNYGIFLYDVVLIDAVHRRINVGLTRADGWSVDMGSWSVDPAKRIDRDKIGLGPAKP